MTLNVVIGGDALQGPLTGIGYYSKCLSQELISADDIELSGVFSNGLLGSRDYENLLKTFDSEDFDHSSYNRKSSIIIPLVRSNQILYRLIKRYRHYKVSSALNSLKDKNTVYHEPNFIPYSYKGPTVITVHDLSYIRYPQTHPKTRIDYMTRYLPQAVNEAGAIMVDSEFVKNEMLDLEFVKEPGRIHVAHLGCDTGFKVRGAEESELLDVLARYGLNYRSYILAVGTIEPRKNLERLVAAYMALPKEIADSNPLVLVGGQGWKSGSLMELVNKVELPHRVIFTGYIPKQHLRVLTSGALLFCYPSLYEGFGLPVLEAMSSGTPVVTSNTSSLAEVAGDGALLVDPKDVDAINNGLEQVIRNTSLQQMLIDNGLVQASKFSWQKCAAATRTVYKALS